MGNNPCVIVAPVITSSKAGKALVTPAVTALLACGEDAVIELGDVVAVVIVDMSLLLALALADLLGCLTPETEEQPTIEAIARHHKAWREK